jgi:CxxC motif-containing protein (DUF1111 family)
MSAWRKAARYAAGALALTAVVACDDLFTSPPDDADVMDGPLPGLTPEELTSFVRGDGEFERSFAPTEGLGPIFNNSACAGCHPGDGRGRPENALVRFGEPPDLARHLGGPQLQTQATQGAIPESLPPGQPTSVRLPPPVFGVGLIEAIPVAAVLELADSLDADGDGVSGRPNWVVPPEWVPATEVGGGAGPQLGRFSRKAQVSALIQQAVEAYLQDMGITSDFLPEENWNPQSGAATQAADMAPDPEVPESTVRAVVDYIRMLAPPAPGQDTPERIRGGEVFGQVGCDRCHVPQLRTGPSRITALSDQSVTLYSDLLLHDMGAELADGRSDGSANGREWRTAPLWGLRVMPDFLGGDRFLLHDGRARSVEEAIELHGGEGEAARERFRRLGAPDRAALIDFVESR